MLLVLSGTVECYLKWGGGIVRVWKGTSYLHEKVWGIWEHDAGPSGIFWGAIHPLRHLAGHTALHVSIYITTSGPVTEVELQSL